jgi:hypothetical protein
MALATRIFFNNLTTAFSRRLGQKEEGIVRSFPGFSMDTARPCIQTGGKYCLRLIALSTFVRKVTAHFGRCLRTVIGIPFGPWVLPVLSPLMTSRSSERLINSVHLGGDARMHASCE